MSRCWNQSYKKFGIWSRMGSYGSKLGQFKTQKNHLEGTPGNTDSAFRVLAVSSSLVSAFRILACSFVFFGSPTRLTGALKAVFFQTHGPHILGSSTHLTDVLKAVFFFQKHGSWIFEATSSYGFCGTRIPRSELTWSSFRVPPRCKASHL